MTQSSKPTVEDLLEFYTAILNSVNIGFNQNSMAHMNLGGTAFPATIKDLGDKRLVLPTREVLRASEWDSLVAFHPLAENIYRGESPVLKKLKSLINYHLSSVLASLLEELTEIAVDKELQKKLKPKQTRMIDRIPKVNGKTLNSFNKIINSISSKGSKRLINIYLKHGGRYKGEDYPRVAITSFPVMDEANNDDKTIFGVKMASKKDFESFFSLMDYILPECDLAETYNHGSRSMDAPYFDALMHSYLKIAKQLNKVTWLFRKQLKDADALHIDVSWEDGLQDMSYYRSLIPGLEGNDGELTISDKEKGQLEEQSQQTETPQAPVAAAPQQPTQQPPWSTAPQQPQQPQPMAPQPQPQPQPQEESTGNGVSWQSIRQNLQQQQQPQWGQQPQQQWGAPQPQQPQMPPGFAGTTYDPQQAQLQQQQQQFQHYQQAAPGTYASHPRNAPQQPVQPQWNTPFGQPAQPATGNPQGGIFGGSVI